MGNLMEREKKGELSDTILRKQKTSDLIKLALGIFQNAEVIRERADRILLIAHDLAEARGEHMGVDGI